MNKQNLWFITLFSIILILCIYYITIPSNLLENIEPNISSSDTMVNVEEASNLVALRVSHDEEVMNQISELQATIIDNTKTTEEKNTAYEQIKTINYNNGLGEKLEKIIKDDYYFDSDIKIDNDQINIVINKNEHNKELANNIIKRIQKEFDNKKYITIKFNGAQN